MKVMVPAFLEDYFLPKLGDINAEVELIPISAEGDYPGNLDNLEILYKFYPKALFPQFYGADVLRRIVREAPRLRWIQSGWSGVESFLIPEVIDSDIILTNGAGAVARPIAETVLGFILIDAKAVMAHLECQRQARWQHQDHRELRGLTVTILGLGKIGLETAQLCQSLGMRVIGTKRRVTGEPLQGVDEVFPSDRQDECVSQADYVVVAAALTPETRGMVNASTLEVMRPDAALINVGRGALVDEPALIVALRDQRIRAAYLDVFEVEPLPPDSPFWSMPNVLITPHNSPNSQRLIENTSQIFLENFRRYCEGQPLINVVQKRVGY